MARRRRFREADAHSKARTTRHRAATVAQPLQGTHARSPLRSPLLAAAAAAAAMCSRSTCSKCSKPTWAGCGRHIESALAGVPEADRCHCKAATQAEQDAAGGATCVGQ